MIRLLPLITAITTLACAVLVALSGCDRNDPDVDYSHIQEVRISPDSESIPVGGTVDFSFALVTVDGDTLRDADLNTRWESTDTSVFTVGANGLATGRAPGAAKCVFEVSSYAIADKASAGAMHTKPSGGADFQGFVGQHSARVVVF